MLAAAIVTWLAGLAVVGAGIGPLTASAWRNYQRSRSVRRRISAYVPTAGDRVLDTLLEERELTRGRSWIRERLVGDRGAAFLDSVLVATLIAAVILLTAFLIVHG